MKLKTLHRPLLLAMAFLSPGATGRAENADEGSSVSAGALIGEVESANDDASRQVALFRLRAAGASALEPTRAARDAAPAGPLRDALHRAYLSQLAGKATKVLQAGIDSQLTFDGQFTSLRGEGRDIVDALLLLIDDEVAPIIIRTYATRALADVLEDKASREKVLSQLRELNADILLAPILREQIEILLAILGERNRLIRDIRRLEKLADSENIGILLRTNEALATLNYRIRNYEKAVRHYDRIVTVLEDIVKRQKELGVPEEALVELKAQMALHYYNAACSNSLHRDIPKAQELLKKAVRLHAEHFGNIEKDGDLRPLREDPSYAKFREELETMYEGRSL